MNGPAFNATCFTCGHEVHFHADTRPPDGFICSAFVDGGCLCVGYRFDMVEAGKVLGYVGRLSTTVEKLEVNLYDGMSRRWDANVRRDNYEYTRGLSDRLDDHFQAIVTIGAAAGVALIHTIVTRVFG